MIKGTPATIWHMLRGAKGKNHAERLDNFYGPQAEHYDSFREKLLHGRQRLVDRLPVLDGCHLVDIGGGTGANLERFGPRLSHCESATVVDLCKPLLEEAERRCQRRDWRHVQCEHADVTSWNSRQGIDLALCSYSLSMIPDWIGALENIRKQMRPGATIGVVDFYVSRKHVDDKHVRHSWPTRNIWPIWFAHDNVFLRNDVLPYLEKHFEPLNVEEHMGTLPWVPFAKVPYFLFIGRRPKH